MAEQPKIPNLDSLVALGDRDGVDIKPTLLRVTTDLYVAKPSHTEQEERHYTELALRLIDQVDAPTRAIVATRLANYPAAPRAVVHRLLRDSIADGPVEETALAAPAAPIATAFAGGAAAANDLNELFFAGSAIERRLILLNLEYALLPPAEPIAPQAARESVRRLEAAALGHNSEAFAREIERTLAITRTQARRLIDDESGEPIVVAAVALAMPADVLQRILLCLNPAIGQSVQRVYELADLYEEIEPGAALRLLAIWRSARKAEQKPIAPKPDAHQPHYWHVEERPAPAVRPKIPWDAVAPPKKIERA